MSSTASGSVPQPISLINLGAYHNNHGTPYRQLQYTFLALHISDHQAVLPLPNTTLVIAPAPKLCLDLYFNVAGMAGPPSVQVPIQYTSYLNFRIFAMRRVIPRKARYLIIAELRAINGDNTADIDLGDGEMKTELKYRVYLARGPLKDLNSSVGHSVSLLRVIPKLKPD